MASSGDHSFENPPTNTPTGQPSLIVEIIPFPLPLDEFIVNSNPNTSSSSWNKVYEALGVTFSNSSGSLNAKVTSFWDTTFSSTENENKFGPSNGSATAVGGDENPSSAVFGMILPTSGALTTPLKFSEVREKFGINNSNANSSLISLLDAVDRAGALMITLDQDPKARNALWIVPKDAYKVIMNMVFTIANEEAIRGLESYIKASYGITISISARNCRFEFQQTSFFIPNLPKRPGLGTNPEFIRSSKYRMVVSFQVASFEVSIICTPDDMEFYFSDPPNALVTGNIIDRLNSAIVNGSGMSSNGFPDSSAANPFSKILKDVNLWYINIGREVIGHTAATPTQPSIPEYGSLYWSIKLFGKWEVGASSETILLGLSYDSRDQTFFGQLLFQADLPTDMVKRQHGFFWVTDDIPFSVREKLRTRGIPRSLNLLGLFSQSIKAPKGVPLELTQGYIAFRRGDNGSGTELSFGTNIKSQIAVEENEAAAPFGFSWDEIAAQVAIQDTGTTSTTDIVISTSINLRGGADIPPATLSVDVEYSTGGFWVLHGRLENLSLALLAKFFHKNNREMAKGLLGTLRLRYADVIYTFNSSGETAGEPSSFVITGALVLGGLELDLTYEFASALIDSSQSAAKIAQESGQLPSDRETLRPSGGESQWSFEADLGASTTGATLGTIIGSFSPNAISSLPTFVTNIDVAPAAGGKAPIKLKLASVGNTTAGSGVSPGSGLILIFVVSMLDTTFTYISLNQRGVTKRVLQVNADQIPIVSDIPLVKVLPPPFDELRYLWVDTPTPVGLSKDEINQINAELEKGKMAKLAYKETSKDSGASAGPVLQTGHHFMVLQGGKVILDHVFGKPNPDSPDPTNPGGSGNAQDPPPTKGAIDKQTPFLTIDGIQLQFKAPVLHIEISATIVLGPINFSVIGFDIGFNLENIKLNNLAALLSPGLISVGLHGLAVKVDKPPVTMSGVFIHEDINAGGVVAESYRGGIAFGFQAWQFMAVGEYRIVTQPQNYKSVFVYAKLDGPLITLAFATVSGVRVGFGYNSIVRSPTLLELPQFPFLNSSADKEAGNDPMKILTAMMGDGNNAPWVSAKEDSYWVAAVSR
ncbi:hypothetical protein M501DRAFT_790159 [Patellaria atrata CBS 101060]|uniref:DUF6603 domain-containing protein n=1 Tax=Patellaria atrata CBS 101060 TaxID=1346257 RepID=A0A9P4VS25_9PEZI|nr:hypothetical protein M501DRAFT_790159 [Patellaria atrata CBS 101060]